MNALSLVALDAGCFEPKALDVRRSTDAEEDGIDVQVGTVVHEGNDLGVAFAPCARDLAATVEDHAVLDKRLLDPLSSVTIFAGQYNRGGGGSDRILDRVLAARQDQAPGA